MKYCWLSLLFLSLFSTRVCSQTKDLNELLRKRANPDAPCLPTKELVNHIDSEVYICDTIAGYKIINRSLRLLYLGNKYPNQLATIIIKGRKVNILLSLLTQGIGHFNGRVSIYKGKPAIIVNTENQTGTRILL